METVYLNDELLSVKFLHKLRFLFVYVAATKPYTLISHIKLAVEETFFHQIHAANLKFHPVILVMVKLHFMVFNKFLSFFN